MKITIVQGAFLPVPPILGGAVEKMWYALAKEFIKKGHTVVYLSRKYINHPQNEIIDGIVFKRVRSYDAPKSQFLYKIKDLFYSLRIKRSIPKDSDIIISNTFWLPIILGKNMKKKCVIDIARMPKGQIKFYTSSWLRGNSSPVIEAIKKEIQKKYYNKIILIPNPLPFYVKEKVNFKEKEKIVLYVGRIHQEKGIGILIDAFNQLKNDWKLVIIGPYDVKSGGGGEDYLDFLKERANKNILFEEPIFDLNKLNEFYKKASIFVYPSIAEKGETFGLSPLESMSWGCVPVVSDLDCFKDFIINGNNGLIFNHREDNKIHLLKDCLLELIEDKEKRLEIACKALNVRETHSVSNIAELFIKEFEKIR